MKLEDQVCSLELAKRLKELGVEQESQFYWDYFTAPDYPVKLKPKKNIDVGYGKFCSAFSTSELGEKLPQQIEMKPPYYSGRLTLWAIGKGWQLAYNHEGRQVFEIGTETQKNMADVFAEMLIHLIEKGIVKP